MSDSFTVLHQPTPLKPVPADVQVDPDIQAMGRYWRSRIQPGQSVPHRDDLDPLLDVPHLVPYVFLADALNGGEDFRIRLCGTRIADILGRDSTGLTFSQLTSGPYLQALLDLHRAVLEIAEPIYSRTSYEQEDGTPVWVERLTMPLRSATLAPSMVMALQKFQSPGTPVRGRFAKVIAEAGAGGSAYAFARYRFEAPAGDPIDS
jgi:hypothetical protein